MRMCVTTRKAAACMTSAFQVDPVHIEVDMLKMAGLVSKQLSK